MKINNKCVKKVITAVLTFAMAVSVFTTATISTYAEEEENPILYLEVSNTLTAQDSFAWNEMTITTTKNRIILSSICLDTLFLMATT